MKKVKIIIPIILIILFVAYYVFFAGFYLTIDGKTQYMNRYRIHRMDNSNKKEFNIILSNYINEKYGNFAKKFIIKYGGFGLQNSEEKFEIYYDVKTPFIKNKFRIKIGYTSKKVIFDNFYDVLANDPKFNHLYSEWIKKKIGCEDRNIELKFNFSKNIDIKSISSLDNNCSELFKNVKNSYCYNIIKKRIDDLDNKNKDIYVNEIITDIVKKVYDYTGKPEVTYPIWIDLYNNDENNSNIVFSFESDTNNLDSFNES